MKKIQPLYFLLFLAICLVIVFVLGIFIGSSFISPLKILKILGMKFLGSSPTWETAIIWEIRLPRILFGFIVGAGLGCVGAVFQGLLGNPLADPYILGSSSGAGLGASLAILSGWGTIFVIPGSAFIGSLLALVLVYSLAKVKGTLPLERLLLSGVIVNTFLFALIIFLLALAKKQSGEIFFWLLGSLSGIEWPLLVLITIITILGVGCLQLFAWELNIISLSEDKAACLGVDIERIKKVVFILSSLVIGAVVSVSGLIGFVGLIIPHIIRLFVGPDHRFLLVGSALGGGIFLVVSDTIARTIFSPAELPVGIVTAIFGAPFFLYLLRKRNG